MKNPTANFSPDLKTWLRLQMTIAGSRAVEVVRAEQRNTEHFANGLLVVLVQALPALLRANPEAAQLLEPHWRAARAQADGPDLSEEEPAALFEARALIYEACATAGVWATAAAARRAPRSGTAG